MDTLKVRARESKNLAFYSTPDVFLLSTEDDVTKRPAYFDKYKTIAFERFDDGVLVVRLHSDNGPVMYSADHHTEWAPAFTDIGMDRDNRVIVLTATGDVFMNEHSSWDHPLGRPREFDFSAWGEKLMFRRLLEIEMPVICAVNGPATIHAELAVLGDIVIASEKAHFADEGHFAVGEVIGDGVQIVFQELLGVTRGNYFLLTGQRIDAYEAQRLGFVNEVLPHDELMPRAMELAHQMATYSELTLRYTRLCLVDRWKHLIVDKIGVGYGMAFEGLAHIDRGWIKWNGSHIGNPDFDQLRPLTARPQQPRPE
ncbi:enoyl-CoA hydratase/isomerase family protein [Sphingobium sp. TKS]|uniref:enoyl-CoA hydratase/isomerase family protein n=2 Tax=unclassified Sphingobium TaxID=2611147 RepID=UPI0009EC895D|nr:MULTISPECIES: enoyl-CoA hydratase/isomerase family protein [unclassified Sphingobium]MEC6699552.1 enoyl-CoA hydratase/isomerase family protein [Sphingobium sp. SJ10-10]